MKDYDLYLFDFDNTLFDTRYGISEILRKALPAVGVDYDDSMFPDLLGLDIDQIFHKYVKDPALYDTYVEEFMKVVATDVYKVAHPFPEVAEVFGELRRRGKRIGIASGKQSFKIDFLLTREGLRDYVEVIVGYEHTVRHKPHPDPVELAWSHFDIPKDRTVYIGDSVNDAPAAEAAGMDGIIVNRHIGLTPDGIPCTFEVSSLTEILDC